MASQCGQIRRTANVRVADFGMANLYRVHFSGSAAGGRAGGRKVVFGRAPVRRDRGGRPPVVFGFWVKMGIAENGGKGV